MESAKWTSVATSNTGQLKLAGGGNTPRPKTIAAAKRASLKRIAGRASAKTDHNAICTTVARMPAITPAHTAALKFAELRIGRWRRSRLKFVRRQRGQPMIVHSAAHGEMVQALPGMTVDSK